MPSASWEKEAFSFMGAVKHGSEQALRKLSSFQLVVEAPSSLAK